MSPCDSNSMAFVARVTEGDFDGSEQSVVTAGEARLQTEHASTDGRAQVLKSGSPVLREVADRGCMNAKALCEFFESEIIKCKAVGTFSTLHLKATTMKGSDPTVFDQYTQKLLKDVCEKHAAIFEHNQVKAIFGLGDALENIKQFPEEKRADTQADIENCPATRPPPAMADSQKGITNSRAPTDATVDASRPAMIRGMGGWGGGMLCSVWTPKDPDANVCCTRAKSPDLCQRCVCVDAVDPCKKNGACNPAAMGSVTHDVVVTELAAEHGSHDKIFETPGSGATSLATPLAILVIQTALTEVDVHSCQPSSMKRVATFGNLLNPFLRKPSCVAGIVFH